MLRGCACSLCGAAITRTIEVVKGTTSSGRPANVASPTMAPMPRPPPTAVMTARRSLVRGIIGRRHDSETSIVRGCKAKIIPIADDLGLLLPGRHQVRGLSAGRRARGRRLVQDD